MNREVYDEAFESVLEAQHDPRCILCPGNDQCEHISDAWCILFEAIAPKYDPQRMIAFDVASGLIDH